MLSIQGRAITRHLEATLQRHQHTAPLHSYYCKRFRWSPDTLSSIDWDTYTAVYTKFPRTRTFFSKVGWKKLPIGERLHKWTPSYDHRCPSCSQDLENDDHLFQCGHLLRCQWRQDLLRDLHDKYGSFLDPDLLTIMKIGIKSFFSNSAPDFSERFPAHGSMQHYGYLITQQTSIGWDHFIRGKIGKAWGPKQHEYAKRYGLVDASKHWQTALVRHLATASFRLWEIRNGCRHGIDAASTQQAKKEQTHREIRCLYHLKGDVLPQDRNLFRDTVETHLNESTSQLRSWITHNGKLIVHSVKVAQAQTRLRTQPLQKFFQRRNPSKLVSNNVTSKNAGRHRVTRTKQYKSSIIPNYFSTTGPSISHLPPIDEDAPSTTTSPQRRQIRRRRLNVIDLYPDHPG